MQICRGGKIQRIDRADLGAARSAIGKAPLTLGSGQTVPAQLCSAEPGFGLPSSAWLVWLGLAQLDPARFGLVRLGLGTAWLGSARLLPTAPAADLSANP